MAIRFTDAQIQEIERLALLNCNSNTIAEATGIAVTTLKRRFGSKLRHWWAIYRTNLRQSQRNLADTSSDMAKFLGKNVLEQVDKQEILTKQTVTEVPESEREAYEEAANTIKLKLSRTSPLKTGS